MSRALTVVQLLPALESGGVERSTIEIADALVRAGHRAIVVSAGGRLVPRLVEAGAEHVALDIGRKRSEEHTSELQSLMRISYAVFCLKKKKQLTHNDTTLNHQIIEYQ